MTRFSDSFDQTIFAGAIHPDTLDLAALSTLLEPAIEAQIDALLSAGTLRPAAEFGAREIHFLEAWNALVAGNADISQRRHVLADFTEYAGAICMFARDHEHAATLLDRFFDEGMSPTNADFIWHAIEATDKITGQRGEIHFVEFQPSFWFFNKETGAFVAAEPLAPLAPISANFSAPNGELLFTDTVRLGAFNYSTDFEPAREYGELSLNSSMGCQARTTAHAAEHNFGFVQTTNTCVAVHRNDATGALLVTERWNDDLQVDADEIHIPGWTNLGGISCDIWRVTAIDRSVAASLIAPADPIDGGTLLSDYLSSDDCYSRNIVPVAVEPGSTWRITCGERFNEVIDRTALKLPEGLQVWALYEKTS